MGTYSTQNWVSHFRGGSSSYDQALQNAVKKGKDQKFYVPTLRGLFVGQTLVVTGVPRGYGKFERVVIKSMGIDNDGEYFVADATQEHPKYALAYNKNVVNSLTMSDISNCDNQSMTLKVNRYNYSIGDSFNISTKLHYMGNIMSGAGDEGAVLNTAEIIQEINSFHGTVESWNPEKGELVYKVDNSNCYAQTLGTSRPMINLNTKKWITSGKIIIIPPGHSTMRGKSTPSSLIIGDKDVKWDDSVVGRYITVNEPSEYYAPGENAGPGSNPTRKTMRWWHITGIEKRDDGLTNLYVERTVWWTGTRSGPTLFKRSNYTSSEKEIKKLKYIIAPGAWVSDVRHGVSGNVNGMLGRAHVIDERRLLLAPSRDNGTEFDFTPGDPITQPPGPDVYMPTGFRVRHFNKYPKMMGGNSFTAINYGMTQVGSALHIHGPTGKLEKILKRQKDGAPSFSSAMYLMASTQDAMVFRGPVAGNVFDFWQNDGNVKKFQWRLPRPYRVAWFYVSPETGHFVFRGGQIELCGRGTVRHSGISATDKPARNLRGISVPVKAGSKSIQVKFKRKELDNQYSVSVQPDWFTMDKVTGKTVDGFTVEFSEIAPAKATIDWQLIR